MCPVKILLTLVTFLSVLNQGTSTVRELSYKFLEDLNNSSLIGNIRKDANLTKPPHDSSTFTIHEEDPLCSSCFRVEPQTGLLKTNKVIDRDEICPKAVHCKLNLVVVLKSNPSLTLNFIEIELIILDDNDNIPTFNPSFHTLRVSEIAPVSSSFTLPTATDPDSPENGIVAYHMNPVLPQFELEEVSNVKGLSIRLILKMKLDRETTDRYSTKIYCTDGGSQTGILDLTIEVTDFNDNEPIFENVTYYYSVYENSEPPVTIGIVKATDADIGENAEIKYSLDESSKESHGSLFQIGEMTGTVNTLQKLDRELVDRYELTVQAKDGGYEPLTGFTKVMVTVLDVNDNPPDIKINNAVNNSVVSVFETNNTNTIVAHITIVDNDVGQNAEFSCNLDNGLFKMEHIFRSEYQLIATMPLDRESVATYGIILRCEDQGSPRLESVVPIKVKIRDVNDVTPMFNQTVYEFSLEENTPKQIAIGQVFAFDNDEGINGQISYSLAPDAYNWLSIDVNNGVIRTNYVFDYEKLKKMTFHVVATDRGQTIQRSSSSEVKLTITDVNDEVPTFSQDNYQFVIKENQATGTQVGHVVATDADSPPFNSFIYMMEIDDEQLEIAFSINSQNGTISSNRPLDRETRAFHNLKVIAKDQHSPYGSSAASVTVFVADENDNAPIIDFPNTTHDTVYVSSKSNIGTILCKILAHDLDEGVNAQLAYSMQSMENQVPFVVHPITGDVVLQSLVSGDMEYTVKVTVMDNGEVPLASQACLTVKFNSTLSPSGLPGGSISDERPINQNIIIIIILSVVFTVFILSLAVVLIILKCNRRKSTPEGPYIIYEPSEQTAESPDKVDGVTNTKGSLSPVTRGYGSDRGVETGCRLGSVQNCSDVAPPPKYTSDYGPSYTQVCYLNLFKHIFGM